MALKMGMKLPHPGRITRQECLEALGLCDTEGAEVLGVTPQALSNPVAEKAGISLATAIRLDKASDSTADTWLRMQAAYDLAEAWEKADKINVRRFVWGCFLNRIRHFVQKTRSITHQ